MKRGGTGESQRSQLATRLAELRDAAGLSTRTAAAKAGLRNGLISKIELGQTAKPTQKTLDRLAQVYSVDPEELYVLAGYHVAVDLPGYTPYLRSKFGDELPPEAVEELRHHFEYVKQKYKQNS